MAILGFELPRVKFLGTPCETLYESPLIFIKVKRYYAFKGENLPTSTESVCPADDSHCPTLPRTLHFGQEPEAWSFLFFFFFFFVSCKVSGRSRLFLIIYLLFSLLSALGLGFGRRRQCLRPGSHPPDMASRCPACPSKARSRARLAGRDPEEAW